MLKMRRKGLLLLIALLTMSLFMSGWIVPSAILRDQNVNNNQQILKQGSAVVATDYNVEIASDGDDDSWRNNRPGWVHYPNLDDDLVRNQTSGYDSLGFVRFQLNIAAGSTIDTATLSLYLINANSGTATIRRIDELNLGALEDDSTKPIRNNDTSGSFTVGSSTGIYVESGTLVSVVQAQIDLGSWQSGYYIALEIVFDATQDGPMSFSDYEAPSPYPAYMNITYTEGGETTDYFTDDAVDAGWKTTNSPSAYYDHNEGRTYVVFQGDLDAEGYDLDPHIIYYDHSANTWSTIYWIADNPLTEWQGGDTHGTPNLWVDNSGYIHVLFGSHASKPILHSVSDNPNDISSFSASTQPVTDTSYWNPTYPATVYDENNNVVHLIYRGTDDSGITNGLGLVYQNSTDNGETWNGPYEIVSCSNVSQTRPYHGLIDLDRRNDELLHFAWLNHSKIPSSISGLDYGFYHAYLNVTSGRLFNMTGYDFGTNIDEDEIANCVVWDWPVVGTESGGGSRNGYPDLRLDQDGIPYITSFIGNTSVYTPDNAPSAWTTKFHWWNGTAWDNQNITSHYGSGNPGDMIIYDSDDITLFTTKTDGDVHRYTWDGSTWTLQEEIGGDTANYLVTMTQVPEQYFDGNETELQVVFCEYKIGDYKTRCYAWGSGGLVTKGDSGNNEPMNDQDSSCGNLVDTDNLYGMYQEYQITANASDADGFADIDYLEITLYSNDRETPYWTVRFDEDTGTFSEQSDSSNMICLNTTASTNSSSGNTLNVTFHIEIHWNHTDLTDTDMKQYLQDDEPAGRSNWTETNWDIETRLQIYTGPQLDDLIGSMTRGDVDKIDGINCSGSIIYAQSGSFSYPASNEIDVWVDCPDIAGSPWNDTELIHPTGGDGIYWVMWVDSDNEVGYDTYNFKVVAEGDGADGTDLLHESSADDAYYIADRLNVTITADDTTPTSDQVVNFTLTVEYDYDDTTCTTYTIQVIRNGSMWHVFTNGNKTLFNDTNSVLAYLYTISSDGAGVSETQHGLSTANEFLNNTETVTWTAATTTTTTTTTTTETGIFYALFLSLNMWSYLGPIGLVIVGYYLSNKDKFLGVLWFVVECLFVAQYLTLIDTTPGYWWHIFILLLGGLFTCVYPLLDR